MKETTKEAFIKKVMHMCNILKHYFLIFLSGIFFGCQSAPHQNPLIGSWERDTKRTLSELTLQNTKFQKEYELVKKVVRCEKDRVCARTILEYTEDESITNLFDDKGSRMSRESSPYHLIPINDGYAIVTKYEPEGIPFVMKGNLLCFELNYKGFKWREYWKPYKTIIN